MDSRLLNAIRAQVYCIPPPPPNRAVKFNTTESLPASVHFVMVYKIF